MSVAFQRYKISWGFSSCPIPFKGTFSLRRQEVVDFFQGVVEAPVLLREPRLTQTAGRSSGNGRVMEENGQRTLKIWLKH